MRYFEYSDESDMDGPLPLRASTITELPDSLGVYLLVSKTDGVMVVRYVGRTGKRALAARLREHLGEGYGYFYYLTTDSERESFELECQEFHAYGKINFLDNEIHPARPAGYRGAHCSLRGCRGEPE